MLLRSSSTPVLGSLLQSFSESHNSHHHHQSELHKHTPNSIHAKISCTNGGSHDFRKPLFHSSPSVSENQGVRRVQSDGNLEGLVDASYNVDEFSVGKRSGRRNSCCTLESIPSISVRRLRTTFESDSDDEGFDEEDDGGGFGYSSSKVENFVLEKVGGENGALGVDFAAGDGGGGGGGSFRPVAFDRDGGVSMEQHYKRMLEENPGDALFLRNYAHFYEIIEMDPIRCDKLDLTDLIKRDVGAAEEYYSRAILADQEDGESLSQYAKIIWELHHDRDRAATYFERAVRISTQDSYVHAAYAKFLWDAEEDEEEEENASGSEVVLHHGVMTPATA